MRVAASGRRLIVSRAQVSDTARFQCVAANEAGDHERSFNVVVHGKIILCFVILSYLNESTVFWQQLKNYIHSFEYALIILHVTDSLNAM